MKKLLSMALTLALALACMAGFTPALADKANDTLVLIPFAVNQGFDPNSSAASCDKIVSHALFNFLWDYDENGNAAPSLVDSWTESEDGTYLKCTLRDDVVFTDGTPFNADVVIACYESALASEYMGYTTKSVVDKIEKVDDYNINMYKGASYSSIPVYCCEYMPMFSPEAYEAEDHFSKTVVSAGPYVLDRFDEVTNYVYMKANPDYFRGEPAIKNVEVRVPLDSAVALVSLETGESQISCITLSNADIQIAADEGFPVYTGSGWSTKTLLLWGEPFLNDDNLRLAINYGVNRVNAAIYNGQENTEPCGDYYAEKLMGSFAGKTEMIGYDPEKAAEYLANSNYDGSTLEINITSDQEPVAVSIQADLMALGINTQINTMDENTWWGKIENASCQMTILDFGVAYSAPEEMLSYFTTDGYYGALGLCKSNAEYDENLAKAAQAWNADEREPYTLAAIKASMELSYYIPLFDCGFSIVASPDVVGVEDVWAATYNYHLWKLSWAE